MHELEQILAAFEQLCAEGKPAALATVVAVAGSSYRRPGARMLIAEDGRTWGGVSGGCLERDVARRGRGVIASGVPVLARYDTAEDADSAYVTPAGCSGVIDVFVQPLSAESPGPMPVIARVVAERQPVRLATVLRAWGGARVSAGTHIVEPRGWGESESEIEAANLRARIEDGLVDQSEAASPVVRRFERPDDDAAGADVLLETIRPPQSLVIFGAGYDVAPLAQIAKAVGWHVTVVGMRPATGMRERFAAADVLLVGTADDPTAGLTLEPDAAVVLVTHNYPIDVRILAALARTPPRYVGILGPRYRSEQLLAEMPDALPRETVFAPVGLDVGADNPQAIALAIVAEIQAVLAARPGGFLKDRSGPIYPRAAREAPADPLGPGPAPAGEWVAGERACPTPA